VNLIRLCAKRYLRRKAKAYSQIYPQVAAYAFDTITIGILVHGLYEKRHLEMLETHVFSNIDTDGICLDVGANIGNHSLFFSRFFKAVYAFEPNPALYRLLDINSRLRNNILTFPYGLGEHEQTLKAYIPRTNMGTLTFHPPENPDEYYQEDFDIRPLDSVPGILDKKISFIKVDIEGGEYAFFKGARNVIQTFSPVIAMEINFRTGDPYKAVRYLQSLGYGEGFVIKRKTLFGLYKKFVLEKFQMDGNNYNLAIFSKKKIF